MGRLTLACCFALASACGRVDFELASVAGVSDAGGGTEAVLTKGDGGDSKAAPIPTAGPQESTTDGTSVEVSSTDDEWASGSLDGTDATSTASGSASDPLLWTSESDSDSSGASEPACTAGTSRYPTVQSVIDDAKCLTVYVPARSFTEDLNIDRSVRIEGQTAATSVLRGTGAGSVATVGSGVTVEFRAVTVREGGGGRGGGIASLAELTLTDVIVTDNAVSGEEARGGGVYQEGGTLTLVGTEVRNNTATATGGAGSASGGGVFATLGAEVLTNGVVFDGNHVDGGGAGDDCTVSGAGVHIDAGSSFVSTGAGVVFSANTAELVEPAPFVTLLAEGAALACRDGSLELTSGADVVTANTIEVLAVASPVDARGGGLFAGTCSVQLTSVSVAGNHVSVTSEQGYASAVGGGVAAVSSAVAWSEVLCANNSVAAQVPTGGSSPAVARAGCASLENTTASVTFSTFSSNRVEARGGLGVVWADAGALLLLTGYAGAATTVLSSTFGPNNEALSTADQPGTEQRASGGAISVLGSEAGTQELSLTSTTISGNRVETNGSDGTAEGGALDVYSVNDGNAHIEVSSSTLAGNAANGARGGGGLYLRQDGNGTSTATLRNTVLAGTTGIGNDCESAGAALVLEANNVIEATTCPLLGAGSALTVDPELGPLQDNGGRVSTRGLSGTSPARDAGPAQGCVDELGYEIAVDARGLPRVGSCDIGAFEAQPGE